MVETCLFNRKGIVTQPMLDTPKKQFLLIGALEAASSILGFIGAAKLPGVPLVLTLGLHWLLYDRCSGMHLLTQECMPCWLCFTHHGL